MNYSMKRLGLVFIMVFLLGSIATAQRKTFAIEDVDSLMQTERKPYIQSIPRLFTSSFNPDILNSISCSYLRCISRINQKQIPVIIMTNNNVPTQNF